MRMQQAYKYKKVTICICQYNSVVVGTGFIIYL